jgi:hypothetical protein
LIPTPVALAAGTVEITVGADVFELVPVVKVQTKLLASALPARSVTPIVIVAVYRVLAERLAVGVKVAVVPA